MEYISREAAKRIVDDINTWSSGWRDYAILQIDSIPAADVRAVVRGKWVQADMEPSFVTCSNCKETNNPDRMALRPDYAKQMKFCYVCGADMREVEHD